MDRGLRRASGERRADDATLSLWVGASDALRPSTLKRKLASIRLHHARAGYAMPDEAYPATRAALAGERPRQMRAATDTILRALADTCDPRPLIGFRNRALLLVGFDGAFRHGELVGIDAEHLVRTADGILVRLPQAKGDPHGDGAQVSLAARAGSPWCPVDALERWLDERARPPRPVFVGLRGARHLRSPGTRRLSEKAVARIVKGAAVAAGLEGTFGAHSLRRRLVTSAIDAGIPIQQVMRHVRRRRLETTLGYAEARDAEANHPRIGLGADPVSPRPAIAATAEDAPSSDGDADDETTPSR